MMKLFLILTLALAPLALMGQSQPKLGKAFGKKASIQGIIINAPSRTEDSGQNVLVQRIDGKPTQAAIRLLLTNVDQQLQRGKTYEIKGSEEILAPSTNAFKIESAKATAPVTYHPRDFKNQVAMFTGVAVNDRGKAYVQGASGAWRVLISENVPWRKDLEGKRIETRGVHKASGMGRKDYKLQPGHWRPVALEDQLEQTVELLGTAKSLNGIWWFDFRGEGIYVRDLERMPGWTGENHWRQIVIRGRLSKMKMPSIDQLA
ncbi:MAG: hypothetical protein AAF585_27965, partial [Verrucomicrobiota bacterium]